MRVAHLCLEIGTNTVAEKASKPLGMRRQPRQVRSQERVKHILDVAEQMFIAEGYSATTTNAIAARAEVPIGSLYQFFPDKGVMVQALTLRYMEILQQRFDALHTAEMSQIDLSSYVDRIIDTTEQFFNDYPGYHAIFMQMQDTMPELSAIESATDNQLIQDWASILSQYYPGLESADYETIAFILVKAIGTLLWLSLSQEKAFKQRLVVETKRLMLSYLQSYFPMPEVPPNAQAPRSPAVVKSITSH
jgi:AcrR family transcriptional regulator